MPAETDPTEPGFPAGGGATGAAMRDVDWAATQMGPPSTWPAALHGVLAICLNASVPMAIYWGPEFTLFYNDAWAPFLTDGHPAMLGQPARKVWPEIWTDIAPIFRLVLAKGEGIRQERQRFVLRRFGQAVETFWSYSLNPIRGARGDVEGILNIAIDVTDGIVAEQRLQDSEAYLRLVLDNSINGIYGVDASGATTFCNAVFLRMLGFGSEREVIGRRLHHVIHHSHPNGTRYEKADCPIYTGAQTGLAAHVIGELFFRADGTSFPVEYWVRPILRDDEVHGAVCTFIDITERLRAEEALRESESRFRLIADSAPVPMWVTRLDRKRAFVNRAYVDFLGTSYEEAIEFDWRTIIHPDDAPRIYAEQVAKEATLKPFTLEARYRGTSGDWRWMRSESQPRWDADGRHSGFIGVAYDVTTAKQAAIELEALNATLEARVEARTRERDRAWKHSQDLQVVVNGHGTFLAANEAWAVMLGWAPEEVVGHNHLDFVHPSFHAAALDVLKSALLGESTPFETLVRHKDGSTRWISWVAAPADGLVYASGRNITAEKAAATALEAAHDQLRQSQKMEAVGQLTGGIAHDFNNLLTGITGSLELVQNRLAQGRAAEADRYIQSAQGAARRAGALTHRLLAFSRRQTLDPKITDVNRLTSGMEELIRRTVGAAIVTEFVGAADLWMTLVDRNQLENALLNLCINARDAMPDGGRLTIETANVWLDSGSAAERQLPAGAYVALSVADTGTGMPPDIVDRAFDPFFTTKPIGQGTGLGLSMIYGFARQSGGAVRIRSVEGHGTTMTIVLPRHEAQGQAADDSGNGPLRPRANTGQTVLVVDDDQTVRMLVVEVLHELRYTALEAESGRAALEIIESDARIDLLITDVGLPGGMNGKQVADTAREKRPGLNVLIITGYAENALLDGGKLEPGVRILLKPFTMDALSDRVRALIGP